MIFFFFFFFIEFARLTDWNGFFKNNLSVLVLQSEILKENDNFMYFFILYEIYGRLLRSERESCGNVLKERFWFQAINLFQVVVRAIIKTSSTCF